MHDFIRRLKEILSSDKFQSNFQTEHEIRVKEKIFLKLQNNQIWFKILDQAMADRKCSNVIYSEWQKLEA